MTPIFWPPDMKSRLIGKDPDARKDWRLLEKAVAEDEMIRHHQWLSAYEFEQTLGDSEGQGSLLCLWSMGLQRVGHNLATQQQQQNGSLISEADLEVIYILFPVLNSVILTLWSH